MMFQTGDLRPMFGAIELHQHLKNLQPIRGKDGRVIYYERNFTSHQVFRLTVKWNRARSISSTSNYLYSTFSHRVRITRKGQCVPISFQRYIRFGSFCKSLNGRLLPMKVIRESVQTYYAVYPGSYRPGSEEKFDNVIPQLSCGTNFSKMREEMRNVDNAFSKDRCIPPRKLDFFLNICCTMSKTKYSHSSACDLYKFKMLKIFKRGTSRIRDEICHRKGTFENRSRGHWIRNRDARCQVKVV